MTGMRGGDGNGEDSRTVHSLGQGTNCFYLITMTVGLEVKALPLDRAATGWDPTLRAMTAFNRTCSILYLALQGDPKYQNSPLWVVDLHKQNSKSTQPCVSQSGVLSFFFFVLRIAARQEQSSAHSTSNHHHPHWPHT